MIDRNWEGEEKYLEGGSEGEGMAPARALVVVNGGGRWVGFGWVVVVELREQQRAASSTAAIPNSILLYSVD